MNHKNKYDAQLALIKSENINVSSSNDGKDFIILLSGMITLILIFIFSFDFIASICIDNMTDKTQIQIETTFFKSKRNTNYNSKYVKEINKLNIIKKEIIKNDKTIQNKSNFDINVMESKDINAMIRPDGSITFTSKLLDEKLTEEELAFVLAHEIGHYSNRDHLKSISKQIGIMLIGIITGQEYYVNKIVKSVSDAEFLSHSRQQERNADLYANRMLIKIYGNNNGGKNFIKRLKQNEKAPEFLYYFSTHPSWNERLYLLENKH